MVFKRIGDPTLINALSWAFRVSALWIVLDHPVYIPRPALAALSPRPYRETACTVQGMARVRSGQAPAWPLVSDRSVRRGSGVKRDFACTFTRHLLPMRVVLRPQSCLRLEGRTRTLSGPSPDLSPARTLPPSSRRDDLLIRRSGQAVQDRPSPVVGWADIPELSMRVGRRPVAWLQSRWNGANPRSSAFQAGHIPSWRGSYERYPLLLVAASSRWLLLLLSADGSLSHLRGLFGAAPPPYPSQTPPPNPTAAEPDGRRVLSRGGAADHCVTPKAPLTGFRLSWTLLRRVRGATPASTCIPRLPGLFWKAIALHVARVSTVRVGCAVTAKISLWMAVGYRNHRHRR